MSSGFQPAPNPSIAQATAARIPGRAHVLVIGNEKGGSGKSTTALHIAVALMTEGTRVATLDLDARQGTLGRYLENRAAYASAQGPRPAHAGPRGGADLHPAGSRCGGGGREGALRGRP